jgi:hypothetical protein
MATASSNMGRGRRAVCLEAIVFHADWNCQTRATSIVANNR